MVLPPILLKINKLAAVLCFRDNVLYASTQILNNYSIFNSVVENVNKLVFKKT